MNALAYLHSGLWPFLLALGIPVWLHLRKRRVLRAAVLPTFRFLQAALTKQMPHRRIQKWLLLILRLLAVLCLVLTFLKPARVAPLAANVGEKRTVILVLDVSLSLSATQGGVSALDAVRGQCAGLLDDLRPDDTANVLLAASAPAPVLPRPGHDFGSLRYAVKMARPTPERADLNAALALAVRELAASRAPRKTLILAGDFQRTNWQDIALDTLPASVQLVLLPAGNAAPHAAALTGLRIQPAHPRPSQPAQVLADVWNGSPSPRTLPVSLRIEGSPDAAPQTVTVPAFGTATAAFPVTFAEARAYRLTAHLPPDALPELSTRYAIADLRRAENVLLLTDADPSAHTGAFFLRAALNPNPDVPGGMRVTSRRPDQLTNADLAACDLVMIDEIARLPEPRAERVAKYLANGGAMLLFLGGPNSAEVVRTLARFAPNGTTVGFVPNTYLDLQASRQAAIRLAPVRSDSPLLRLFRSPDTADLTQIHVSRFFVSGTTDARAEVLLTFADAVPALVRSPFGAGSLLECNFSPAPHVSDLAQQPFFPPLLHEWVKGMTGRGEPARELSPGQPATLTPEAALLPGKWECIGPDGETLPTVREKDGGTLTLPRVPKAGFYRLLSDGREADTMAVNAPREEADLRRLALRDIEQKRGGGSSPTLAAEDADSLDSLRHTQPLWPCFLLLTLLFLLLEQAVSARRQ